MSEQSVIPSTRRTGYDDDELEVRRRASERLPVAAAIAFVVLFVAAMVLVIPYDTDQDDAALIAGRDAERPG